jgi:hypothetical protein
MDEIEYGPCPEKGWTLVARVLKSTGDLMLFNGDLLANPSSDKPVHVCEANVRVTCACHRDSREVAIRSYAKQWRNCERPPGCSSYYAIAKPDGGIRGPSLKAYLKKHREVKFEVL